MFGKKAVELVRELVNSDSNQVPAFNIETVQQVVEESHEHHQHMVDILLRVQSTGVGWRQTTPEDSTAFHIHHHAILHNKRCVLAYVAARARQIRRLRWQLGAALPPSISSDCLSPSERDYFHAYSAALGDYLTTMSLDLTVDLLPPKDPYIEVRVLQESGAVVLDDKVAYLEPNTVHLIRRTEAEPLILRGLLEHRQF